MSEQDESLRCEIRNLTQAINSQSEAITRLANSNAMIAQALAEQIDDEGEGQPPVYLDGRSVR